MNQRRDEYGYEFLNTPMYIEGISFVLGFIMMCINLKVQSDKD